MKLNITARAARWSAAHWKTATGVWLAFVAAAIVLGSMAGSKQLTNSEQSTGETARAEAILEHAGFESPASESVIVQGAAIKPEVRTVIARLRTQSQVKNVRVTHTSKDGRTALVEFDLLGDPKTAKDRVQPVLDTVAALQKQAPRLTVAEFGGASFDRQTNAKISGDLSKAEKLSLPITFLILLIAFGAFVAAGVPVLLAISAVIAALGLNQLTSHVWHTAGPASSVIVLIGMAVGVDYSLFYVKREREERHRGHGDDALIRAAGTSGMSVLVSGATVLIAMAGMLLSGSKIFTALGIAAMLVVAVAVTGSLTVLPALLGKLGDRIDRGAIFRRLKGNRDTSRVWDSILRRILAHPWIAAATSAWLLVLLALPALSIHTSLIGVNDMPKSIPAVAAFDKIDKAFPSSQVPATVVLKAPDVTAPSLRAAIAQTDAQAVAAGIVKGPARVDVNSAHTVATIDLSLTGGAYAASSMRAITELRSTILPHAFAGLPAVEHAVTGDTAGNAEFNKTVKSHFPYVFAFVLGFAFLLLLVTFRSVVVPLTAIVLNLLSVCAAYGVLVWVFQDGHLQGLLGFHSSGSIVTWLPLFLFAVLFALSMDYHVFIVSRIKELVDGGASTADAVSEGIRTTAGTVTSAAVVMVAVFSLFASLSSLDIKQMGFGLAVAVLLDATIIRGVLLPATMKLLGRANWYLPHTLRWLPHWRIEVAAPAVEAAS